MSKPRLLVVGNGMSGLRFLEEIVAIAPDHFDITVAGEEPDAAYNRVLLSPLLAGEISVDDTRMKSRDWYRANAIRLITGSKVVSLDTASKTATLANYRSLDFDACVLATGSQPIRLNFPGAELAGVEVFRTLQDIERLSGPAQRGESVIVVGGGLLGIEAAYGLKRAGANVTLVHLMDRLMERQLDRDAALMLKAAIESKGITVCLNSETARIDGDGRCERLVLKDGRTIEASLVVMAVGVRPNSSLASQAGIVCKRGVAVDDQMQTSVPGIFAIGECAEHQGQVYGLVEPAYEHARVVAHTLSGKSASYGGTVLATNLKVSGVPVFSAGDFDGVGAEHIVWRDAAIGHYRKFVVRDNRLKGVVFVGDTTDALWYRDLIRTERVIAPLRSSLAFGRAYAEAAE